MINTTKWLGIVCFALVAGVGCGYEGEDADTDEDTEISADSVRISGRFEITLPDADVWAGTRDLNNNISGVQIRVEVHQLTNGNLWADHGNERFSQYRIQTTGEERATGAPRLLASSAFGAFRAVDGAFLINNALYLVGNSTGGGRRVMGSRFNTRNEKSAIVGIRFNGRTGGTDTLVVSANVEAISGSTFAPSSGSVVFNTIPFSQVWADTASNEPFACYNINSLGGQFLSGTSPTDFRSVGGGFVLDGTLYALGQATGGATATGVPGSFRANAPRRALANYGSGAAGTGVNFNISITSLPSP